MKNLKGCYMHESDEWETPNDLFKQLDKKYLFDIDLCANEKNHKCKKYYSNIENTPIIFNKSIFCNPPYSQLKKFIKICSDLAIMNNFIVMLIPARTDTKAFHDYLYNKPNIKIEFIKGRLKFEKNGIPQKSAPFPSMIVYIGNRII